MHEFQHERMNESWLNVCQLTLTEVPCDLQDTEAGSNDSVNNHIALIIAFIHSLGEFFHLFVH